jgi:putative hydrolase of the HAD superfamily
MSPPELDFSRVRVVTFDAGGTLLKPIPGVGEIYAEILAAHGINVEPKILTQRFRSAFTEMAATRPRAAVNEATELAFWREIVRRCVTPECADKLMDDIFAELWQTFAEGRRWAVLPGAIETLRALGGKKRPLAVLSNWDSRLHQVLKELGLRPYFSQVFISSEMGAEKPDWRAFQAVEKALQAAPECCLHIGDHYEHDYAAARAAGWQALLLAPYPPEPEPTAQRIDSLALLAKLPL